MYGKHPYAEWGSNHRKLEPQEPYYIMANAIRHTNRGVKKVSKIKEVQEEVKPTFVRTSSMIDVKGYVIDKFYDESKGNASADYKGNAMVAAFYHAGFGK